MPLPINHRRDHAWQAAETVARICHDIPHGKSVPFIQTVEFFNSLFAGQFGEATVHDDHIAGYLKTWVDCADDRLASMSTSTLRWND